MALESAGFISALNSANPISNDGLSQGDDHIRLLKATLLATFPNFTAVALAATQAQIDAGVAVDAAGVAVLADAGAHFKTNTTDGVYNPSAGTVTTKVGGVVGQTVTAGGTAFPGTVTPVGAYKGGTGQLVPTGFTGVWWTDTLPTGYLWANGAAVSRSTYAELFTLFSTAFGVGDGSTTFNLPNLQEASPVGKSTMGGASSPGRITNYTVTSLGAFIGLCNKVLTIVHLPNITLNTAVASGQGSHAHVEQYATGASGSNNGIGPNNVQGPLASVLSTAAATLPAMTGTTPTGGSDTPVPTVTPSVVCNWIIKT